MPLSGYSNGTSTGNNVVRKEPSVKARLYLEQTLGQIGVKKKEYNSLSKKYAQKMAALEAALGEKNREYLVKTSEWETNISKLRKKYDEHIKKCDMELVKKENELEAVISRYHTAKGQYAQDKVRLANQQIEVGERIKDLTEQRNKSAAKEVTLNKKIKELDKKSRAAAQALNKLGKELIASELKLRVRSESLDARQVEIGVKEAKQLKGLAELSAREKTMQVMEADLEKKKVDIEELWFRELKSKELAEDLNQKAARLNELEADLVLLQKALRSKEKKVITKEKLIKEAQNEVR